ncbi:hypothetical protein E3P81_04016 [Wallemia ichthyophaga]|nr:hypothetical protein E3P97_04025 [Wallemia ichthyophaga]TIB27859.1 hypothetical protein E3P85_04009 [Wallemia ichthyophaga]TIB43408.1 hypothetical protein E3P82_04023 [Wallemia ichthyophaga]TIB45506.1 hypothetical protein E3P81_04016 [Wallemia ichthyophaga]TIB47412.1 hypothetical protein E3P80_04028 [Wallemia ichthyophaga]
MTHCQKSSPLISTHDTLKEEPEEESRPNTPHVGSPQAQSQAPTGGDQLKQPEQQDKLTDSQQQQANDEESFIKNQNEQKQQQEQQRQNHITAKHNEHMRRVKSKRPLWGIGGVFPAEDSEKPSNHESGKTQGRNNDISGSGQEVLNAAAEAVFSRGRELGYQQASSITGNTPSLPTGNLGSTKFGSSYSSSQPPSHHTNQAGDYFNLPGTTAGTTPGTTPGITPGQHNTPFGQVSGMMEDNKSTKSSRTPFQVGGVIDDNRRPSFARPQPSKRFPTQTQQHSYYKEQADKEMADKKSDDKDLTNRDTQGKEEGQVGGIIDGQKDTPAADQDRSLSYNTDKSQNYPQGGGTGQVGEMENKWLDDPIEQEKYENPDEPIYNFWFNIREYMREPLAEMLGTCVFMIIGTGASCQTLIYTNQTAAYTNLNWGFGVGVMTGVYIAGGISGGHLNPAITLFLALFRGFPWKLLWKYWIAQVLGAFIGSFTVYGMYCQYLYNIDPAKTVSSSGTAALFPTIPSTENSTIGLAVYQEVIATAVLTSSVLALGDRDNTPPGASLGALVLALIIMAIGTSLGALSGYAMNPARDLGPRIMLSCVGYGKELWTHDRWWWLTGPILGSFGGSILGALAYDFCIYSGLGSPVNFTGKQWRRLINPMFRTHNMAKAGLDRLERDRTEKNLQNEIRELENKKGNKAV